MKIAYIARHGDHGNRDEDAVGWALERLGHEVVRVEEADAYSGVRVPGADFLLFHKWAGAVVRTGLPKVFWFWDKVADENDGDPILAAATAQRRHWMARTLADPELLCGFCTDGDWVNQVNLLADGIGNRQKLIWLTQGFDERQAGLGTFRPELARDVVFFGTATRNGARRRACLEALRERFGERLWVLNKETRPPLHGRELADLCVSAKVVVAPDGPSTDRYWSNRVYLVTGLGGCLAHPVLAGLEQEYDPDELAVYRGLDDMLDLIDVLLKNPVEREWLQLRGRRKTTSSHTYRHRCAALVEEVKRRLACAR